MIRLSALLALAAALSALVYPSLSAPDRLRPTAQIDERAPRGSANELIDELGCAACHAGIPATPELVRARAPALGAHLSREYLFVYLQAPTSVSTNVGRSRMPDFHLDERESLSLALYIQTLSEGALVEAVQRGSESDRDRWRREFRRAERDHGDVSAEVGARIFSALNCAGCHAGTSVASTVNGPDLSLVGRLQSNWLREYLAAPTAVRPFGFVPGSGGRMPDFGLEPSEIDSIAMFLEEGARSRELDTGFQPTALSAFSRDKAERFLRDRLPCLGCHRLDGEGGQIGPDLSGVGLRLEPNAVFAMIANPNATVPGTVMPHQLMPPDRVQLLANYLVQRTGGGRASHLSLVDNPPRGYASDLSTGAGLYGRYCANCHGDTGEGDGYNAAFLPVTPTRHADSAYMSTRPDDTLFDGVHAGGYILNRSHRMPAFGQTLTTPQIRSLVRYMRELCRCEGPAWSRDGKRQ